MALEIADYGFLSDCRSGALVGRDGSVDWWPGPRFDGPTVFARLLDPDAGHFSIRPVEPFESTRRYLDASLVLETTMRCASGVIRVTDCLALGSGSRGHDIGLAAPCTLVRVVEGEQGTVPIEVQWRPRPEYGLATPELRKDDAGISTIGGSELLSLTATLPLRIDGHEARARLDVGAGERIGFVVSRHQGMRSRPHAPLDPFATLADTAASWRSWTEQHRPAEGHPPLVERSLLVLQGLTYQPSGALVAAPTTSLPERPGGVANWDYRFGWLRDASMTARALGRSTCSDEAMEYFVWMTRAAVTCAEEDRVQILFGVEGERTLHEQQLHHLAGYQDSRPVRIGNAAWCQLQLDVLGEVVNLAHQLADDAASWEPFVPAFIRRLVDRAARDWRRPDAGIWEGREGEHLYTSSRLMCWVALDRGIRLVDTLGAHERIEDWVAAREAVRAAILAEAWSDRRRAFTGAFGSEHLDVSVMLIPLMGFLDPNDPRVLSTLDALERELGDDGLLRRWTGAEDGAFLLASFWLAEARALAGQGERARAIYERAAGCANDLGLLAEEVDPASGRLLGNFPLGLSHMGLINAEAAVARACAPK